MAKVASIKLKSKDRLQFPLDARTSNVIRFQFGGRVEGEAVHQTEVTVFRSTDQPLGKTMKLDEHGKVVKTPDANMWQGFATRTPVTVAMSCGKSSLRLESSKRSHSAAFVPICLTR